ncbi:MAG: zinc ribbon domain-containing protein [bacterium]
MINTPQIRVRCRSCKKLVDEDAVFCKFCGANMFEDTAPLRTPPAQATPLPQPTTPRDIGSQESYAASPPYQETYRGVPPPPASQPGHDRTPPSLTMLSGYGSTGDTSPAYFRWWHGLIILMLLLLFVGVLGGAWWWWSNRSSTEQSQQQQPNVNPTQPANNPPGPSSTSTAPPSRLTTASAADDELKRLREWRIRANPSATNQIIAAFDGAEKNYPTDYRFPYERAKLSIKGTISHHEAFEPLFRAAEKAIDSGKEQEMLDSLTTDKDDDFYKLSRGHHEWEVLEQGLRNKDKAELRVHVH